MRNTILVLNNYSINRVLEEIHLGVKPSHHVYGITQLQAIGYQILAIDTNQDSLIYKIGKQLAKIPLCNVGDLYLQAKAIRLRNKYSFIYAPCQDVTIFLGVLRFFKLFDKPIIALAHHPFLKGRFKKLRKYSLYLSIKGHSQFPAISSLVSAQINAIAKEAVSPTLAWGPDVAYYSQLKHTIDNIPKRYDLIAIGRTGRDYVSFIKAFLNTNYKVAIFCSINLKKELLGFSATNIDIHYLPNEEALNYHDIARLYAQSKVLAIPLTNDDSLCGLTSITDGIGFGMPVLMTFNKYVDIQPNILGFGEVLDYSAIDQWSVAAKKILSNIEFYSQQSENATEAYNIDIFSKQLDSIFNQLSL